MQANNLFIFICLVWAGKAMSQPNDKNYLALGDSYTIGEGVPELSRWPNQLATLLSGNGKKIKTTIIATTGWRTDNLANAIQIAQLKNEYDLVSLLIGVNNQYQGRSVDEFSIEFEDLLKTAIHLAKGQIKNVFVVSIPDYGYTPFGEKRKEKISTAIDHFNFMAEKIAEKYGVLFIDITPISREGLSKPDMIVADGLHPSEKMYALWVTKFAAELRKRR